MNFQEWLTDNGVTATHDRFLEKTYHNLENIIGKRFWICDYRLNNQCDSKPIRSVSPKLVQVFSNDDLPKNKNVYYSPIHFREVKGDKCLSTVIAPFDNTGYRGYTGVSVNIFNTQDDCEACFRGQCDAAIRDYENALKNRMEEINARIAEIQGIKAKYA